MLKKEYVDLNVIEISIKQCFNIITNIFGLKEKEVINKFSIMIKSYFSNQKNPDSKEKQLKIRVYQFLYLVLEEYHQNKLENESKYNPQNQISFENFNGNNDNSFNCDKLINDKILTTTKNLKPEFDSIFNEMNNQNNYQLDQNLNEEKFEENQTNFEKKLSNENDSNQNLAEEILFSQEEKQIIQIMESNLQE